MKAKERRRELLTILKNSDRAITGSDLSQQFMVSRQVIVQDIALLRAHGEKILATSQGYILTMNIGNKTIISTIACQHSYHDVEDELLTIISHGAKIIDVIVEHPLYGELRGLLMIQTYNDVQRFMAKYKKSEATLLSSLTDGVHLHTIETMNIQVVKSLKKDLKEKGFLLEEE